MSLVLPAGRAVLKVTVPHRESEHEADALEFWGGEGAARLLAADRQRHALLLERCVPGTPLDPGDVDTAADVLRRLWRPAPVCGPFRVLVTEAERWRDTIPAAWERFGRPFERVLVDRAVGLLGELGPTQRETVVLHQDLHAGNVLRGGDRWLAIDPKPLAGEREFDVVGLARNADAPRRCVDALAARLELDAERARGWAFAHALAWGFDDDGWLPAHVDVARALV
jgi:streptomycin 6-kinase